MRHAPLLVVLFILTASATICRAQPEDLLTTAERTGYTQTATHADVMDLARRLADRSPRVHLTELGRSVEGRELPLLIVAEPPVTTPEEARASGKVIVLLIGNIHAGEVCGKEALMMLARELALADDPGVLKSIIVCIAPIYNADGNERMEPGNRPGQVGPERMGVRPNAQGYDLNRDFVKAEAPETRALIRCLRRWDPHVFVDTHTTNGSAHRYVLTYSGPKHPAGDAELIRWVRDGMLPRITETLRDTKGHETFFYGNFEDNHAKWTSFPAEPRYSTNYVGLRNRIAILSEAYSYAPFKDRVVATLDFCRAIIEDAAGRKDEIIKLLSDADRRAARAGESPKADDHVAVRTRAVPLADKAPVKGFETEEREGRRVATDRPRDYECELWLDYEAELSVRRPWAYLVPSHLSAVIESLKRHGITVEELRETAELDAELLRVDTLEQAERPFQGHRTTRVTTSAEAAAPRVEAGTAIVRTAQPLGPLAMLLLEPMSEDGLTLWNFLDDHLAPDEPYPIRRVLEPVPLTRSDQPPIDEDRVFDRPITFDSVYRDRRRPDLNGSPVRVGEWIDDEHFAQTKDGTRYTVNARTGRATAQPQPDPSALRDALAALPTIDAATARRIADRSAFSQTTADRAAGFFEHGDDLYYARLDGSAARRLTATPAREELASFSPDGRFVAFVRDNDLFVVDVDSATERRLTTTGSERLLNGKADWVYFEEVFGRSWRTYWWSPDSSRIAFFETDTSMVDTFTIIDDVPEPQRVETATYPKPGRPNPEVRVGIAAVAGGTPRFADLSRYTAGSFIVTGVGWWPDSRTAYFFVQDRAQRWLDFCTVDPNAGAFAVLFRDSTEAWIEAPWPPRFLKDGSFLLDSERTGWKHIYHYARDGSLIRPVTTGEFEVRGIELFDEANSTLFFTASTPEDDHLTNNLYRVNLDGTGLERLTTAPGSHRVSVNPSGTLYIDTWSDDERPARVAVRAINGTLVRTLDTNPVPDLDEWRLGRLERARIPSRRGPHLDATILYPPDFDPARPHPVWFTTYAGPHAPTVRGGWSRGNAPDHMLANLGFVVFRADPYSASGKGAVSAWTAYRRLGVPELEDIIDAITWLRQQPGIDGSRIGMSGHSYGGFITAYAMTNCDLFAAGIAGAPVTDWRDYDTIYTERYMDTPQENPAGYDETSAVKAAKNLHGRLLILHGTMDDNVHMQNATRLAKALQEANRPFEIMLYPQFRHGIWGDHYRDLVHDFQLRLLNRPPGPPRNDATTDPSPTHDPDPPRRNLGPGSP